MCGLGLVAMTVGLVVHHLAVVDTPLVVNLPEDDTTMRRGSDTIATGGIDHLIPRQEPNTNHRLTKLVTDGQALPPQQFRWVVTLLLQQGCERWGKNFLDFHLLGFSVFVIFSGRDGVFVIPYLYTPSYYPPPSLERGGEI